jgi:hypothetical protein
VPVLLVEPDEPPGAVLDDAAPEPPGVAPLPVSDDDPGAAPELEEGDDPPGVVALDPGVVPAAVPVSLPPAVPAPLVVPPVIPPAVPPAPPAPALGVLELAPGLVLGEVDALLLGLLEGLVAVDDEPPVVPVEPVVASFFLPQPPIARVVTNAPSNIEYFMFMFSPLIKLSLKHSTCS